MLEVILVVFCIACALYWLWSQCQDRADEPPLFPGALPILGHLPALIGDKCTLWYKFFECAEASYGLGGVVRTKIGPRTIYVVTDPDEMLTISNACLEKSSEYDFTKALFGEGLITGKASIWKKHRKLISPAFSQIILDNFIGVLNKQSRRMVKDIEKEVGKGLFNQSNYIDLNTMGTVFLTVLGIDILDSTIMKKYYEIFVSFLDSMMERLFKFWWYSPYTYRFSPLKKTQDGYIEILNDMSETVLKNKKAEINKSFNVTDTKPGTKFKPYVELLLELSQKGELNDMEVLDHINTIMGASFDTTNAAIILTLFLLGSYPEVQEKAFAEIKEILGDEDRDINKHDLSKLVYLEAVIKESMRIHSPVPMVARKIVKDIKLKNCTLYAGRSCCFFLFAVNRHPIWGLDRCRFRPERWLDPSLLPNLNKAYAAFSIGKRTCIGKAFVLMSMKTNLAYLIRHYRIVSENSPLRLRIDVTIKPESGYFIKIEKRTQSQENYTIAT